MMKTNGNDPAIPVLHEKPNGSYDFGVYKGLTKREQFAIAAMQGICANPQYTGLSAETKASKAVFIADNLVNALNK